MKVITLSKSELKYAAEDLLGKIIHKNNPDLIVGVATGGQIVMECMKKSSADLNLTYSVLRCQRNLTETKKSLKLKVFVRYLPRMINDFLRVMEHHYRQFKYNGECPEQDVILSDDDKDKIVAAKTIVIVDDAVDSGCTLFTVVGFIKTLNKNAKISTASITVTWKNPIIFPNILLYKDTLIRFPWSEDA